MNGSAPPRREESGIALVIVLLVLILTSILALEIKHTAALHMKLARNKRNDFLMQQAMRGQLEVIKQAIHYDLTENQIETLQDRWLDDRYTNFQEGPSEEEDAEDRDPAEPVSSLDFELTARVEDEGRKLNLRNLFVEDEDLRKHWRQVFIHLITTYREDWPKVSISESRAIELMNEVEKWVERPGSDRGVPKPATPDEKFPMVTPDELLMVKGFDRDMFYDKKAEEGEDGPIPGLSRYLTLWSDGPVNLNTADEVMVKAMFVDPQDSDLAERFLQWRDEEAEEQPEAQDPDDDPMNNSLKSVADLSGIDGFSAEALQRNRLNAQTVGFTSNRFSVYMVAESDDGLRRQERWVVERNPAGFTTLLTEVRDEPVVEPDEEATEE